MKPCETPIFDHFSCPQPGNSSTAGICASEEDQISVTMAYQERNRPGKYRKNVGVCNHISLYPYIEREREEKQMLSTSKNKDPDVWKNCPPPRLCFIWMGDSKIAKLFEFFRTQSVWKRWLVTSNESPVQLIPLLKNGGGSHRLSQEMIFSWSLNMSRNLYILGCQHWKLGENHIMKKPS